MKQHEREKIVRRIVAGKVYAKLDYLDQELNVVFTDPDNDIIYYSELVYEKHFEKCIENKIMTLEQSYAVLKERGEWNDEKEAKIQKTKEEVDYLQENFERFAFQKAQQRAMMASIERGKKLLDDLIREKNQLFESTAEFLAERAKKRYIVSKIYQTEDDVNTNNMPNFLDTLCLAYFDKYLVTEKQLREIARTDPWRLYWCMNKQTGNSLFKNAITEITQYQYLLCSWSRVYDYAYENNERPTDDIIENDDKFDIWLSTKIAKDNKERQKRALELNLPKNNTGVGRSEVFIMADAEGAKDVYNLNDPMARTNIKKRTEFIQKKGYVREQDLPDVQKELRMAMNQQGQQEILRRSK